MQMTDVKNEIVASLGEILGKLGFKSKKEFDGVSFTRKFKGGANKIGVAIVNRKPNYEIGAYFSIRFDSAANVSNEITNRRPEYHADTVSLIKRFNYFTGKPNKFQVSSEQELRQVLNEMAAVIEGQVIPLMDKCTDLVYFDRLLNTEPSNEVDASAAREALIIARLVGNPRFEELVTYYKQQMAHLHLEIQADFAHAIDGLRKLDVAALTASGADQ